MNYPNPQDFAEKKRRIRAYLDREGFDAMILLRRDNFAWATFGGDTTILRSSELGFGALVFTRDKVYLSARYMDASRIMEEELYGLDVEVSCFLWHEDDLMPRAIRLAGGGRIVSDVDFPGCENRYEQIRGLQVPYTPWEIEKWHQAGALFDAKFLEAAQKIERGMTEQQAAAILADCFEKEFVAPEILLVGGDERIAKYRHPLPSDHKLDKIAMIHLVGRWRGMCLAITRMLTFGPAPEKLLADYDLLNQLQASAFARLIPGQYHGAVLEERQRILAEHDRLYEYGLHFPGAEIGFSLGTPRPFLENEIVHETQCYDIYLTVEGAKVEELAMAGPEGAKLLSCGSWPTKTYTVGSYRCDLPIILEK